MHKDERLLSQEEKELMLKYRDLMYRLDVEGSSFLKYYMLPFIEANIRPPQEAIDITLTLLAMEGLSEEDISETERELSSLPVKVLSPEGTA